MGFLLAHLLNWAGFCHFTKARSRISIMSRAELKGCFASKKPKLRLRIQYATEYLLISESLPKTIRAKAESRSDGLGGITIQDLYSWMRLEEDIIGFSR
uniref:Uncharacterized protein n=1 Tax=Banana bunchy top virus TaxID=12585 RepID=Q9WI99_BBTV|nr:unknown [Banana bunchy top virus]